MVNPTGSRNRPLVALDALLVHDRPTGVGRSILELVKALAAADRGMDFLVLATHPALFSSVEGLPHWRVLSCPGARGGTLRKAWFTQTRLPGICRREGAALLHSLQFVAPVLPGPWQLPCPSVVTVHDLAWIDFPGTVEQPRRAYYGLFVPRTLGRAALVVTNSKATAEDTLRHYPRLEGRVRPTLFGTPSWVWERTGDDRECPPERPFFLFVGTLEPRKNLENLLRAYRRFLDRQTQAGGEAGHIPRLRLVGGKGWKDSGLRRLLLPLVEQGQVEVQDYCDIDGLWRSYRSARALLFPSLHEGFGFPILEAMASGLPVMTSRRGAMAEVAGDHALLVDPLDEDEMAQGMSLLAGEDDLHRSFAESGPGHARKWTWEITAQATCRAYGDVLARALVR